MNDASKAVNEFIEVFESLTDEIKETIRNELATGEECTWCGEDLDDEEIESPRLDDDGDPICDDCYHDNFEFTCCRCEDYAPLKGRDNVGDIFVIVDEDEAGLPVGVYEILSHPYWASDMLSSWFHKGAIKKVSDDTFGVTSENLGYAAGHLCDGCQEKIREAMADGRED